MHPKQKEVYDILKKSDKEMTLEEIYKECDFGYYHNWKKHLGNIMSTAVKSGRVERVKRGVFKVKKQRDSRNSLKNTKLAAKEPYN